jgi:hypothetical protein
MPNGFIKDPDAKLPYSWDWGPWLTAEGDTISAATVLVPAGLTAAGEPLVDGSFVTQRIEGGDVGSVYKLTCRITTAGGLVDERSMHLTIMER